MITLTKEEYLLVLHCLANFKDHANDCSIGCELEELRDNLDTWETETGEAIDMLTKKVENESRS